MGFRHLPARPVVYWSNASWEPFVPEVAQQPDSDSPPIDLKDPVMAALLAWLVPGLGHWYQGRRAKAVLFFVCIMGLFVFGLWLGGSHRSCINFDGSPRDGKLGFGRAVYFSWRADDRRLPYLCQIGVGLAALPALVQANQMNNHRAVFCGGFMAPPRPVNLQKTDPNYDQPTAHELNKLLARYFELAGVFTMVAGLLNVLAIYDAWAGPVVVQPAVEKKEEETESK